MISRASDAKSWPLLHPVLGYTSLLIGGGGCALSQDSSALTHSVLILRVKSCLLSACVRARLLWMQSPSSFPPSLPLNMSPLMTGLKLLSANMLILFLTSDFGHAPRLSFLPSFLLSSSSFLAVVPWLCRNFFPANQLPPESVTSCSVLLPSPSTALPLFWVFYFFHFHSSPTSPCPRTPFLAMSLSFSLIMSVLSGNLFPPKSPTPFLTSLPSRFFSACVFFWKLVGGCGGPSWVVVCFDVLV